MPRSSTQLAQLAEGTRIMLNGRGGNVYLSRPTYCEIVWNEWTDPETGEVHSEISDALTAEQIALAVARNGPKAPGLTSLSVSAPFALWIPMVPPP